jgi:2-dehydro-3-deoxyphosphooctonate aldolase (KDO 8-P synthase)
MKKESEASVREVVLGSVVIGGRHPFVLIAGPCVIETEASTLRHAEKLKKISLACGVPLVFKSSYDKANRTSLKSFRGPGLAKGLKILKKVKSTFGLPLLCDVHSVCEVEEAGGVLDCLQIPAFLCRQTDLLVAAAKTKKAVNVKKGQFLAPWNMEEAVKKIEASGNKNIILTERGSSFGYNNLVVDYRSLGVMRSFGCPVVFDATHSVQLPGGKGVSSGGERRYVPALSRAALAFGCDGIFLEVHEDPDQAPCDGPNMIAMNSLEGLLKDLKKINELIRNKND